MDYPAMCAGEKIEKTEKQEQFYVGEKDDRFFSIVF